MNRHWVGPSLLSVFLLAVLPGCVSAQSRRGVDFRCSQVKDSMERRISSLKLQQQNELNECRAGNGKNSELCRSLKEQQQQEIRQLRQSRDIQLHNCINDPLFTIEDLNRRQNQNGRGCGQGDRQPYVEEDDDAHGRKPSANPPPAKIGPPEQDGAPGTNGTPNQVKPPITKIGPSEKNGSPGTTGSPNQVNSAHNPTPHPVPITSDGSGGSSRSSGSQHSSGSGNSYSSGGSSGSHESSGGGYSGGGYSGGSSAGSSSAGHSSGGSGMSSGSSAGSSNAGGGGKKN